MNEQSKEQRTIASERSTPEYKEREENNEEAENQGTTFDSEYDAAVHHKQQMTSPRKQSSHTNMKL